MWLKAASVLGVHENTWSCSRSCREDEIHVWDGIILWVPSGWYKGPHYMWEPARCMSVRCHWVHVRSLYVVQAWGCVGSAFKSVAKKCQCGHLYGLVELRGSVLCV